MRMKQLGTTAVLITLLYSPYGRRAVCAGEYRVTLKGVEAELDELPVVVEIGATVPVGTCRLESQGGLATIPAEVFEYHGKRFLALVLGRVPRDRELTYRLARVARATCDPTRVFSCTEMTATFVWTSITGS